MPTEKDPRFERFLAKEFALPPSLQDHIRRMKGDGEFDKAMKEASRLRRERVKSHFKKSGTVDEELLLTIEKVINSDDPDVTDKFRALWLLHRKGEITLDGVAMQTKDILVRNPHFNPEILGAIKDEVMSLRAGD